MTQFHRLIIAGLLLAGLAVIVMWSDVYLMRADRQHDRLSAHRSEEQLITKTN